MCDLLDEIVENKEKAAQCASAAVEQLARLLMGKDE